MPPPRDKSAEGTSANSRLLDARIPQTRIAGLYDRISPLYDLWAKLTETRARKRALELADIRDGKNILEVAVGTGLAFYEIARRNPHGTNTGIDLSAGMLARAWSRLKTLPHSNYALREGDAFDLDIEDNSIDTLMNTYMFDLIPHADAGKILLEFRRVLRPGGKLVLVNMTEAQGFGSGIYKWIYRMSPRLMGGCRPVELTGELEKAGFDIDTREYHQQMRFPSEVIRAFKRPLGRARRQRRL